jgi:hypothetical protein
MLVILILGFIKSLNDSVGVKLQFLYFVFLVYVLEVIYLRVKLV